MATVPRDPVSAPQAGPQLLGTVREHGTATHRYASGAELRSGPSAARNLADAVHFLAALHGRYPGVIELVAARVVEPAARAWLAEAAEAFATERALLASLVVRAGPLPGTPGAGSEATVAMQRSAILTLTQSERRGCAIGAALAIAADWAAVRGVLDAAGQRFGAEPTRPWTAGSPDRLAEVAETIGDAPGPRRAMLFGAEQVAIQHRGLWDLLQARAAARAAS